MKGKRMFWGVALLAVLTLMACIATFSILAGSFQGEVILLNFALNIPFCIFIGYADYKIVSFLHKRQKNTDALSIVANVIVSNLTIGIVFLTFYLISCSITPYRLNGILQHLLPVILLNSMIVLIIEAFFYNNLFLANKVRLAVVEKEKTKYQLENLKRQVNPHFLFNCLNVLSALAYQDADKANLFTKKLSSVYRYLLATQEENKVPLPDELDFVNAYIYLEQIRFGETLFISMTCDKEALTKYIVPASVQMLVENALKHNINTRDFPLRIDICIGKEHITVTNNLQLRSTVSKNGVGLKNLEEQYRIHGKCIKVRKSDLDFTVTLPLL
ncbi:sensor histidine kinase [uncultured Bacteroides sp.]|uniref:sensor histidine kinase n=1 Tax=uncultured Bacteroides sp. TaxID=162156 RepID=UPI00267659FD|nr:sensor histidine kinase [uncultured Bacteroides sp.]